MAKEGNTAASALWRDLFSVELYKRSQGRIARQATFAVIALGVLLGAWSLRNYLVGRAAASTGWAVFAAIALAGAWGAFRLVNYTRFADFLIAVEAEMNKVSWPTRSELIRASAVVLITIFGLAMLLFAYDLAWRTLLQWLEVLPKDAPPA